MAYTIERVFPEDIDEIFTYLGRRQIAENSVGNIHCFFHRIMQDPKYGNDEPILLCGQVYNCLIHEQMIDTNDAAIIFNMIHDKPKILPVLVTHANFNDIEISSEQLVDLFNDFMAVERNDKDIIIIKAVMKNRKPVMLNFCEMPLLQIQKDCFKQLSATNDMFLPLERMLCIKPIPYL